MSKRVKNSRKPARQRPLLEEIEPRILYSADFAPGLTEASILVPQAEQRIVEPTGEFTQTATQDTQTRRHELVFVDPATPDYDQLIGDIRGQSGERDIEVVLLDATRDGIEQITDALAQRKDISAVHLVAHGSDAAVRLGSSTLNFDALLKNATQIKSWANALTADADLLIYGCDVAQQADGKALVDALARLTGADVAASENSTGAAAQGGDWDLEYRSGSIETGLAVSATEQRGYSAVLAATAQGGETRANTTTNNTQQSGTNNPPRIIAMDANGNYVVVWDGYGNQSGGQSDTSGGVFFQRYNANGVAQGVETKVNTYTTGTQQWPSVAMDANGNFVIAWTSDAQDGDGGGIYAQRYNASGVAQGGEFRVNTSGTNDQAAPVVAMNTNGFVITWNDAAKDGGGYGVYAKRYNASGVQQGSEFLVNVTTAGNQWIDSAAMDGAGNFIITWTNGTENSANPSQDVYFRRFNSAGGALTGEVRVNTTTGGDQNYSTVAMNASGAFVISWDSGDGSNDGIYARRYDASGTALGSEFRVNTTTTSDQHMGRAGIDSDGNFVVVWTSYNQDAANTWGVYKQEYYADGSTNGSETRVNSTTGGDQFYSAVAMNEAGRFVVAWSGSGPGDTLTSSNTTFSTGSGGTIATITAAGGGVFFQRYTNPGVTVTPSSGLTTTEAGGTASFTVVLDTAPTANVTISIASTDPTEGTVSTSSLTFTTANWNAAQTVTVTGIDDAMADGNVVYSIVTGNAVSTDANYNNMTVADVSVTNTETTPSEPARTVNEDSTLTFSAAGGNAINVTDGTTTDRTMRVQLTVTNGIFTLSQTTGLTILAGANGSSTMTVSGLESNLNAALNGSTYTPTANYNGPANLKITSDVLAQYTFENAASLGTDASGNYNGTVGGSGTTGVVDGTRGNVASMNGSGYVQVSGHLGDPSSVTVAAWVNLTAADTLGAEVISLGDSVALRLDDSVYGVGAFIYNGSTWLEVTSGRYIAGTGWHLVAFTFDNTSKAATLSMDGNVLASATFTGSITYNQGANSFVGKHGNGDTRYDFNGKIDDVRVYGRALSAAEIAAIAAGGSGPVQNVAITVNPVNDAPTRTGASVSLAAVAEDTANPAGATVSSLFTSAFSDATDQVSGGSSANTLAGVAVTANAANSGTEGRWQWYNGSAWVDISTSVSSSSALVLASGTSMRFLPNADYNGTPGSLTVRLIDNSAGAVTSGTTVDVTTSGGITRYSDASNAVTLGTSVTAVNDAPLLTGANNLTAIGEDPASNVGTLVSALIAGKVSDADSAALSGIAVTAVDNTNGAWQYSTNGGTTWTAFGTPSGAAARLLAADANTYVRFVPNANWNGTVSPGITFRAWDQTSGSAGGTANTGTNGGSSAFSSAMASAGITVNAVNDAPTRTAASISLGAVAEDTANPPGAAVSALFASVFSDATDQVTGGSSANTLAGVAVTANAANSGTEGRWQWYNGSAWVDISTSVSGSSALVLASGTSVRFLPNADYNGTPGSLTVRLIDNSAGAVTSGTTVDVTTSGGTTQYSDAANAVTLGTGITAANDAPVLTGANNLTANNEDPASNAGTLVSALISGKVSDVDSGALSGIAVTAVDNSNGTWQYSTNGGTSWTAFGTPSGSAARLLAADANTYVRFVPNANWNGTVAPGITFRAWDQISGTAGSTADTSTNGGSSAFSSATASASITVNAVNDAPTRTAASVSLAAVAEDTVNPAGATVSSLFTSAFSDATDQVSGGSSANALAGVAVTANAANSGTEGRWQWYNGSSWVDISTSASASSALVLASGTSVRFLPNADYNGTPGSLTVRLIDNSSGAVTSGTTVNVTTSGGTTQYSDAANAVTLGTSVTAANDAPVLSGANNLTAINEDPASNAGTLVSALISGKVSDVDSAALSGIAVTAVDNSNGAWQYSTNGGTSWTAFGTPSGSAARLLAADANTYVRFVPNADWNGTVTPGITFRAWDQTSGTAGGTADTSSNAGTTAFSSATATSSITVNAVNDAPTHTVPAAQGTTQNTALVFSSANGNQISIADVDAGGSSVQVTLTATNGTLTLSGLGGLAFTTGDGTTDATMTFTGTLASINTALNGLSFDPTTGFSGAASLAITTDDQGNTGSGGAKSANSTVSITVNAALAPTASNDAFNVNEDSALNADWWNTAWTRRSQIALDGNSFGGAQNLTDFPVLVALNSGNIDYAQTQNAGQDLRFFDADGSPLAYEIESWNESGTSYVWVKVPQVDTSGTDSIWMYYGNASAPAGQNPTAVWTTGFSAVYHLNDSGAAINDSTASNFDGTAMNGAAAAAGEIAGGRSFDGTDDYIDLGANRALVNNAAGVTLSTWINTSTVSGGAVIMGASGSATINSRITLERNGDELRLVARSDDSTVTDVSTTAASNALVAGVWEYVTAVVDVAGDTVAIYVNGVAQATTGTINLPGTQMPGTSSQAAALGANEDGGPGRVQGLLDEARFSTVARSAAWVHAEYLNMTGAFATVGAAQSAPGTGGVLQNDSAPSGQPLSAVLVGGPSHASAFTLNADGTFSYTPVANFAGSDTFTYRANDGTTNSNLATVTITVNPVNDAPVGSNKTITVAEDGAYTFAVTDFGFTDPNDSPANSLLSVKITTLPAAGSLTLSGAALSAGQFVTLANLLAGDLEYTPAANANGAVYASFTFQVRDDGGTANSGVDTDATPRTMTIDVSPVNDAPVLTGANDLTAIGEDPASNLGTLVSALIAGNVTDIDSAASGIAVTAVDNSNGAWQYSTDGGGTWTAFGSPSAASARLLAADANTYVRFVPSADWNGTVATGITFRAWDQSSGSVGGTADTSTNGGITAFSSGTAAAGITVNPVNDAPVIVSAPASYAATEQVPLDLTGSISITDVDAAAGNIQATLSVVAGTLSATPGTLGVTVSGSGSNSLTLTGMLSDVLNLLQGNGGATLSYVIASDAPPAGDVLSVLVDDQGNTGLGGAKTVSASIPIAITAVNDAPTLSDGAEVSLSGTDEDTASSATTVSSILIAAGWADADATLANGIAVTAVSGNGSWQYSTNGVTWTSFGSVSASSALLLDSATQVRYLPDAQSGETATFAFRAWDKTSGTASTNGSPSAANPGAGGGGSAYSVESASVTIAVTAVNDAPVLDASGAMALTSIDEDDANNSGDLVSTLIASAGGDRITDVDSGAVEGIAVTALVSSNGTWEYSVDGGTSWSAVGAVSDTSALLLRASDRLRFLPDGLNADVASVSFRAWDQSSGAAGGKVDVSSNGGSTAFSSAIETASLTVTAVNDAPVLADTVVTLAPVNEDAGAPVGAVGTLVSSLAAGASDVDSGTLSGIAIIAADTTHGSWFYSTDNGASWAALGNPDDANSRLLTADAGTRITFQPDPDYNGTLPTAIVFRAWDGSSGVNAGVADTTTNGGTSAFSAATDTASLSVNPVNDAPTGAVVITGTVTEDQTLTADTSTIADADGLGAFSYQWARSTDGGTTWSNIGGAAGSSYTLGDADVAALIRVAVAYTDGDGTPESLTSADVGPVANVNDAPTGAVAITGTATEDQTLTADTSTLADADGLGALTYQWARSTDGGATWSNIAGATASTHVLGDADVDAFIQVTASYTDGHGSAESLTSATAGPVANVNDAPTGAVTITGSVTEDQTLTADTSTLADADGLGTFSYQWAHSTDGGTTWIDIAGATASTYALGDVDVGTLIQVSVSYTDGWGTPEGLASAAAGPVANMNDAPTGAVTIAGVATEDQTLTADPSSIADIDGLGTFSYQWVRSTDGGTTWSNIGGAIAITYMLGDADVNALVQVSVSYTDGWGTVETVTSGSVGPVANVNDAPTGAVVITGSATEDQTLTADTSTLADADGLGGLSYQWARSTDGGTTWSAIGGATASSYTLGDADVNGLIRVSVSYIDGHGTAEGLTSALAGPVANVNDAPTGAVAITGMLTEDQTLTADTSTIGDADGLGAFSYQWARSTDGGTTWGNIVSATTSSYTLGDADVGNLIRVQVTYSDGWGTGESLTSATAGPVVNVNDAPAGAVAITGVTTEDQVLTADTSSIGDADGLGAFSYQWARSTDGGTTWSNIGGATGGTYTLGDADVGNLIQVSVSYTDGQGTAESLTSSNVGPVANVNDAPTGVVAITGVATEDQVLTADPSSIADADGLGAFSYQWARSTDGGVTWNNIGGATAGTYTVVDADVNALIQVSVSYTDGQGTAESLTSSNVGPVANVNDAPTGAVAITGSVTEDQVLTADPSSIADVDGLGAFSYQWARSTDGGATWLSIGGASASTYTLVDADVNALIQVSVSYTDGQGTAESLTSSNVGPVANLNDAPTGAVAITGSVTEDQVLTADTSSIADADGLGAFSYQWARSTDGGTTWNNIGGATAGTYTLGDADVGNLIQVSVSYTDGWGTAESLTSGNAGPVANVNDAPTGVVAITGVAAEDQVLTADPSSIADADGLGAFSYQWARSTDGGTTWLNIGGASASTYTLGDADVNALIQVSVSYTDGQGTAESLTSSNVGPVANLNDAPTGVVTITGTATEDQVLTADTSAIADADGLGALSYQWARSNDGGTTWNAIGGASASTYTLGDADVDALIQVTVSYTDGYGTAESLNSTLAGPVDNINDTPSGAVMITGSVTEDQTLTADTSSIADADGLGAFSYQWARSTDGGVTWNNIGGATAGTYTLGDADVNALIQVSVSYTDGQGTAESLTSSNVGPVANVNDAPTGAVAITGSVTEDQVLTADTSSIADADGLGAFSYQWARSTDGGATWNNIGGATAGTYTLGDADVNALIQVSVSYTDGQGTAESLTSSNVGPVANVNDAPTGAVAITGTVTEDQVLTADPSSIADIDGLGVFGYQWARSTDGGATWSNIAGATASTYLLGDADAGNLIRVGVSYIDGYATAESLTSSSVGPVVNVNDAPAGLVIIAGSATEDQVLTADTSSITDADGLGALNYQWARSSNGGITWVNIAGAGASTYTLGDADVNALIQVRVAYTDGHGTSESLTSVNVGPVANVDDAPVLTANALSLGQGNTLILGAVNVSASDVDNPAAALVFTVSNLAHGRFELISAPGTAITSFTQAEVAGGLVRFVHDGGGLAPSYQITVSDGALNDGPLSASVRFSPSGVLVAPTVPPAPAPVVNPAPPPVQPAGQSDGAAVSTTPGPVIPAVFSPGRIDSPDAQVNEYQLQPLRMGRAYQPTATLNHFIAGPHIDPTLELLAAAPANLQYLSTVPVDWTVRPAFPDAGETPRDRIDVLLEQVQMGGMALSVGVVWWASRVSGLLGSLLASAPAWRHIDPLPVVGRDEDEDKKWYDPDDADADANELAIANVLDGGHAGGIASRQEG